MPNEIDKRDYYHDRDYYNDQRRSANNFRSSLLLSVLSVVFAAGTIVPGDINPTGRNIAAFLAGMFGFAAIESIRRSY